MQEDDVIHALVSRWRPVAVVLASGGNQSALSFTTAAGRRKSPDVVAYVGGCLLALEAKPRASGLFAGGAESDVGHLIALRDDPRRRGAFVEKAQRLLVSMGRADDAPCHLVCGALAGSPFAAEQLGRCGGLVCLEVDPHSTVAIVSGRDLLPDALAYALG